MRRFVVLLALAGPLVVGTVAAVAEAGAERSDPQAIWAWRKKLETGDRSGGGAAEGSGKTEVGARPSGGDAESTL